MAEEQVVWFKARAILKKVTWSSWTTLWVMPLGDMTWGPPSWSWLVYTYQGHPCKKLRQFEKDFDDVAHLFNYSTSFSCPTPAAYFLDWVCCVFFCVFF